MWPFAKNKKSEPVEKKAAQSTPEISRYFVDNNSRGMIYWNSYDSLHATRNAYATSDIVFACVSKIAASLVAVPWVVQTVDGDGEWSDNPAHPLNLLLKNPNPQFSWNFLLRIFAQHFLLTGNAVWYKTLINGGQEVSEVWPIMPENLVPSVSKGGMIQNYKYYADGFLKQTYKIEEIFRVIFPDPSNFYTGLAPLKAAGKSIDIAMQAHDWNKQSFSNRGVMSGYFKLNEMPSPDIMAEVKANIKEDLQGIKNARDVAVLPFNVDYNQLGLNAVDLDYINGLRMSNEEICRVFGVPPVLVGDLTKATYSNYREAERDFWNNTAVPFCKNFSDEFNRSIASHYGDDVRLWFKTDSLPVAMLNLKDRVDVASKLHLMGVPFNEINKRLNLALPEIDNGDVGYVPSSLVTTDEAASIMIDESEDIDVET